MLIKKHSSFENISGGVTLIELLVVLAIASILLALGAGLFSTLTKSTNLDKDVAGILSQIERARNDAINSVGYSEHGVRFASTTATRFSGTSYSAGNVEAVYTLGGSALIQSVTLSNSSDSLYFNKITGKSSASGTITIILTDGSSTKTIRIYGTGFAEVQ